MAATTTLLGLVTPTQGTLSGTWGDTVNYGISDYVDISVAGTLTLTNDGAVTLANTTGSSSGNSITSSLTGAGTVTAQFAIVKVTGTLTVAKVVTGPSYSKTYTVVNSATGGIVTFKASGQTGVSVAVGESAFVYYNGTDYVKVSGTVAVASFQTSLGGLTPSTATTGVVTLAGTLNTTSGGTGLTSFTAGDVPYYASGSVLSKLAIGTAGQFLTSTGTAPQWSTLSGVAVTTFSAGTTGFTPSSATSGAVTLAGTLATTNGGTGLTSFTSGGVVYASSASVLATGSALTFDGANLGIAATVTGNSFTQYSNSADGGLIGFVGNAKALFGGSPPTSSLGVRGETNILFGISSTEAMRLTSTGLGIGTSSPSVKLDITGYETRLLAPGSGKSISLYADAGGSVIGYLSSGYLLFGKTTSTISTQFTEQMRLDASGNLGLGVTPSAWDTVIGSQVGRASIYGYAGNEAGFQSNCYFGTGNWRHIANGTAEQIRFENGEVKFRLGASGTAGGVVSFTQAMTLDASGNLGVGTTSPVGKVDVQQSTTDMVGLSILNTNNSVGTTTSSQLRLGITNSAGASYAVIKMQELAADDYGALTFGVQNSVTTTPTERLRITSTGNVGIGTNNPSQILDVVGGSIGVTASGASFNLINVKDSVDQSGATYVQFLNSSGGNIGNITRVTTTNAVTYNTTSDYRLKTVTGAVTGQGARIDALKPIDYLWTEGGQQARGFLAHEFQAVYSNSVTGDKDAVDANGNAKYQAMQAATSEVIADLVAEIQSLRQRLSAANL